MSLTVSAQEITIQTERPKPKTAAKQAKPKPKPKAKPKARVVSRKKPVRKPTVQPKPQPTIATIEAATKDGKPVTLRSDGTWQYAKQQPVKETQKPVAKASPTPTPKPVAKASPTPTPKPVAKASPTPKPDVKPTPPSTPANCELALKDSPVIRGLRLGMSRAEANRIIPQERVLVLDSPTIIAYPQFTNAAGFENVYQIIARFADEALSGFTIEYDADAKKWKSGKEFAKDLSDNFNLPYKYWKFNARNAAASEMQCRDFTINLDSSTNELTLKSISDYKKTAKAFAP